MFRIDTDKGTIYQCQECTLERIEELKGEKKMQIKYNVTIPKSDKEDINALYDFCDKDAQNMCITYEDKSEAIKRMAEMKRVAKRVGMKVEISRIEDAVYITKVGK